ncbi:MAG: hypothetical protein ACRAS9_00095 [Mycoplasma sp.]
MEKKNKEFEEKLKQLAKSLYLPLDDEQLKELVEEYDFIEHQKQIMDKVDLSNTEFKTLSSYECSYELGKRGYNINERFEEVANYKKNNPEHWNDEEYVIIPKVIE